MIGKKEDSLGKKILNLDVLIAKEIQRMLEKDGFQVDDKLPSERKLAEQFQVQRLTIRSALQILIQKGIITSKERRGYFVQQKRIPVDLKEFKSTTYLMADLGIERRMKLLEFEVTEVTEHLSGRMMLPVGTKIIRVMRLRYKKDKPISLEKSYLVYELVLGLKEKDLENHSMYQVIREKFNVSIAHSNQKVTVVYANELETKLLKVRLLQPLMKYQGLVYDKQERLIEFFENTMLIDEFEFISR